MSLFYWVQNVFCIDASCVLFVWLQCDTCSSMAGEVLLLFRWILLTGYSIGIEALLVRYASATPSLCLRFGIEDEWEQHRMCGRP